MSDIKTKAEEELSLCCQTFCTPKSCVNYYCYRRLTNATISRAKIKNMPMADFSEDCKERISPESVRALED